MMYCCVLIISQCSSSQWHAVVSHGTSLIYYWYIDSEPPVVNTNNQV